VGTPTEFDAPPYIAHLVTVASSDAEPYLQPATLSAMYRSVRPYGGALWFPLLDDGERLQAASDAARLSRAKIEADQATCLRREGALEGAAPWTHLYGDVANTVKSDDRLVKAPLGLLWFGGNTHDDVLPRHSHAPSEQVLGGRLFVEGVNTMTARDVYTGRVLWRREFESLGTEGIYFDDTYADTPLSTKYNQVHIPGANARGTNFVAADDGVYLVIGDSCEVLDTATGETVRTIPLPEAVNPSGTALWTYLGIYGDLLIAGVDFANGRDAAKLLGTIEKLKERGAAWSPEWFASRRIAVIDRATGGLLWRADADHSFLHNGIVAGGDALFVLDKLPRSIEGQRTRRGLDAPDDYRIAAFDARTGEIRWESTQRVFGTWLSYSDEFDMLVEAGAAASDRSFDEVDAGLRALQARTGETAWEKRGLEYSGPCILHNDKVITNSRSYTTTSGVVRISDGEPILIENPLTGDATPWTYQRTYGCNTAVASEHLLTFRSGAAGYYDLNRQCGVANLGGFRSGCTSNLIAADGVLNAPDFTRTCSCGYQNQTSLALVHMPDVEMWT
ncbi:MAG: PQQ-binding-like beta-propeller repeat protein, partial [Planctomycetota bacterium]